MSTTKQKILAQSVSLFNTRGITNVSLRTIAEELGISVGNLQYHYKKREDIVEALYFQLVDEIDAISLQPSEDVLQSFFNISRDIISTLYEYRFFLLDFVTITRNNIKIKNHYSELSKRREQEFLQVTKVLIQSNILREERLINEYQLLYRRTEVLSNFWFSSLLIQSDTVTKQSIDSYAILIGQSIFPYLTPNAQDNYAEIFPDEISTK